VALDACAVLAADLEEHDCRPADVEGGCITCDLLEDVRGVTWVFGRMGFLDGDVLWPDGGEELLEEIANDLAGQIAHRLHDVHQQANPTQ
jgi:hypothetical protein